MAGDKLTIPKTPLTVNEYVDGQGRRVVRISEAEVSSARVKPNHQPCPGPLGNTCGPVAPDTSPNPYGNSKPDIQTNNREEKSFLDRALEALDIPALQDLQAGALNKIDGLVEGSGYSVPAMVLGAAGRAVVEVFMPTNVIDVVPGGKVARVAKKGADATGAAKKGAKKADGKGGGYDRVKPNSLREQYLGRTPGKNSKTGKEVQERMRSEGKLRDGPDGPEFRASDGDWYPLKDADMAHNADAVKWWNETGRDYGAKSTEVREWMLDSKNYTLDHYSINRSAGANLPDRYLPPTK